MPRKPNISRNPVLVKGINKFGRSASARRGADYKIKNRKPIASPKAVTTVEKAFGKKGQKRVVPKDKGARYFPEDEVLAHGRRVRKTPTQTRLRASLKPGTVVIIVAGVHKGKHAVVLKQLPSGLLLVTGPYKLNGVPLRRISQAFVIATSTSVDMSSVKLDAKFDDTYFKKAKETKKEKPSEEFFSKEKKDEKKPVDPAKQADQKAVDQLIVDAIKKTPHLAAYITSRFTLKRGVFPHQLKF